MRYKVRWCLKTDLFTHKENIYTSFDDFYSFITFWLKRFSDFKCVHIYNMSEECEEGYE